MIINILLNKGYGKGYLPKDKSEMIQAIFPTANLAIRRTTIQEAGPFDTVCKTSGEDMDLCIRVSKTPWELFFEPKAIIHHKHRTTILGLLKQWYGYGHYHPHIFKKHTPKCLEICYFHKKGAIGWSSIRFEKILGMPLPFHILLFATPFHLLNIFLAIGLLGLILKVQTLVVAGVTGWLLGWAYFSGMDFIYNVVIQRNFRWMVYSFLRYILNWAFVLGAFLAGLRIGVLSLDVTREQTPPVKQTI